MGPSTRVLIGIKRVLLMVHATNFYLAIFYNLYRYVGLIKTKATFNFMN